MVGDLHWYVSPKHRKKGYLTEAMKDIILSHLFQSRDEQRITIKASQIGKANHKASLHVALSLGFRQAGEDKYVLKQEQYLHDGYIDGHSTGMDRKEVELLKQKVKYFASSLKMVQTEVEMKLGTSDVTEDLCQLAEEINTAAQWVEDAYWNYKGIMPKCNSQPVP